MPKLIVSSELIPEHLPPAAGAKAWSDQFEQLVGRPGEYTFADDVPFHARLEAVPLDGAVLWSMRGTFLGAVRTKEAIRSDGSDCPSLIYNFAKPFRVAQRGRETVVGAGSAVLFTEAVTGAFSPGPVRSGEDQVATLSVRLPRAALAGAIGTPEDQLARAIDPASEPLRVLKSYADMLMASGGVADPAIARAVGDHLVDLVALTVGANRDAAHLARERGLRAGRLNEVLAAINARYADPGFSLQVVAK